MKRIKILAIVLVSLFSLVGIAYAIFKHILNGLSNLDFSDINLDFGNYK